MHQFQETSTVVVNQPYLSGFSMMVTEILMHFEGFSHCFSLIQRINPNTQARDSKSLKVVFQFQETSTVVVNQAYLSGFSITVTEISMHFERFPHCLKN